MNTFFLWLVLALLFARLHVDAHGDKEDDDDDFTSDDEDGSENGDDGKGNSKVDTVALFNANVYPALIGSDSSRAHVWTCSKKTEEYKGFKIDCAGKQRIKAIDAIGLGLTGVLHEDFGKMDGLVTLKLQDNAVHGSIPPALFDAKDLRFVKLANNQLSGILPGDLQKARRLRVFDVRNNQLTGFLPYFYKKIETLDVGRNLFYGPIPDYTKLKDLRELHVDCNRLSGVLNDKLPLRTHECVLVEEDLQAFGQGCEGNCFDCSAGVPSDDGYERCDDTHPEPCDSTVFGQCTPYAYDGQPPVPGPDPSAALSEGDADGGTDLWPALFVLILLVLIFIASTILFGALYYRERKFRQQQAGVAGVKRSSQAMHVGGAAKRASGAYGGSGTASGRSRGGSRANDYNYQKARSKFEGGGEKQGGGKRRWFAKKN